MNIAGMIKGNTHNCVWSVLLQWSAPEDSLQVQNSQHLRTSKSHDHGLGPLVHLITLSARLEHDGTVPL